MADRPAYVWTGSEWDTIADPGAIRESVVDAAGDLLVGSADNTVGRLGIGQNGYVLTVDTSGSGVDKIKWAALPTPPTPSSDGFNPFLLMGA